MKFTFLPAEVKFYDYFERATANLLEGARLLQKLLDDFVNVEEGVAQITEIEHRGDFIVHEVTHLLPRTLITPIDGDDIQRLVCSVDDALDAVQAAAVQLSIYQITEVKKPARRLAHLIVESAQELDEAMKRLRNKKLYDEIQAHIVEINTLENNGDRVLQDAVSELVEHRDDIFDFIRWKEIYELLEATLDAIEDAGDVIQKVMIANA
jgi:predicted phosphate transport protein (TIGR00153 family)